MAPASPVSVTTKVLIAANVQDGLRRAGASTRSEAALCSGLDLSQPKLLEGVCERIRHHQPVEILTILQVLCEQHAAA